MAKREQKGNRESKETKEREDQNNRRSAEPKGHSGGLAADVRIRQNQIETSARFGGRIYVEPDVGLRAIGMLLDRGCGPTEANARRNSAGRARHHHPQTTRRR